MELNVTAKSIYQPVVNILKTVKEETNVSYRMLEHTTAEFIDMYIHLHEDVIMNPDKLKNLDFLPDTKPDNILDEHILTSSVKVDIKDLFHTSVFIKERSEDDEVLSVKSSLTLKEVDETLNLNLANEKKIEQIREGYLEAYKFLEDLSNKIDEKISQDEDLKDIILTPTNPAPFQLNYGLPELYPQSLHRPIKHIDKLLQSNVLHKLEYKEKLTKFNKLSQSEILTFLSSLRNNCMFGNNTNAEANVDKIVQTFIQKSDCDNMKNGIYIKPILIVKSIKGPNQGLVKIYDLLKHGYELNTYYNIEVK